MKKIDTSKTHQDGLQINFCGNFYSILFPFYSHSYSHSLFHSLFHSKREHFCYPYPFFVTHFSILSCCILALVITIHSTNLFFLVRPRDKAEATRLIKGFAQDILFSLLLEITIGFIDTSLVASQNTLQILHWSLHKIHYKFIHKIQIQVYSQNTILSLFFWK